MKKLLVITLMASFSAMVLAQGSPISVTGFTQDVIANGTNVGNGNKTSADATTTTTADSVFVFYNQGYIGNNDGSGLPNNGAITSLYDGTKFQLASYSANNDLMLFTSGESDPITGDSQTSGALTLGTAAAYSSLQFLVGGYNGAQNGSYTINFAGGTTSSGTFTVPDNFNSSANIAYKIGGRLQRSNGAEDFHGVGGPPNLDQVNLTLNSTDSSKLIDSVTFSNTGVGGSGFNVIGVYAMSGTPEAVPTPAMLLPFGLGALVLLNRKRRI